MAYNLPPPWDAGFALPDNVLDEGLERRGFVTKELPRGTYDQIDVGTGGYAVPQYVMDEGYGQGTFTTKWEPRGQYDGGKIPHWLNKRPIVVSNARAGKMRVIDIAAPITVMPYGQGKAVAMSGDDGPPLPKAYQDYGNKAAAMIIARVSQLPPQQRSAQLRMMLDKLDKTLWKRTQTIARDLVKKGFTPGQAFRAALARAMSAGIAAEIIRVGQTGVAPQPGSLLGLGCSRGRQAALGADIQFSAATAAKLGAQAAAPTTNVVSLTPCPGYSWTGSAWVRTRAGAADVPGPGGGCPAPSALSSGAQIQIGPFSYPAKSAQIAKITVNDASAIPADWKPFLRAAILRGAGPSGPLRPVHYQPTMAAGPNGPLRAPGAVWKDHCYWFTALGVTCDAPGPVLTNSSGKYYQGASPQPGDTIAMETLSPLVADLTWQDIEGHGTSKVSPVARFKNPVTGEDWGVFMGFKLDSPTGMVDATHGYALQIYMAKIPEEPWYESVLDALNWLPAKLIDAVADVVIAAADMACDLVNSPNGVAAAGAAGGPAGAAGAGIAQRTICGPNAQPPPLPPTASSSILLPVAILGGAAVVAILLSKKKKAP